MKQTDKTAYELIGVAELGPDGKPVSQDEIQKVYFSHKKAMVTQNKTKAEKDAVDNAYAILENPTTRKEYDASLVEGRANGTIKSVQTRRVTPEPTTPDRAANIGDDNQHQAVNDIITQARKINRSTAKEAKEQAEIEQAKNNKRFSPPSPTTVIPVSSPTISPTTSKLNTHSIGTSETNNKQNVQSEPDAYAKGTATRFNKNEFRLNNSTQSTSSKQRSNSDPQPQTKTNHLTGNDLKQAIINNRTTWQNFTARVRGNSDKLTINEQEAHKQLDKTIDLDNNEQRSKSNDTIKNTLYNVRKKSKGRSASF